MSSTGQASGDLDGTHHVADAVWIMTASDLLLCFQLSPDVSAKLVSPAILYVQLFSFFFFFLHCCCSLLTELLSLPGAIFIHE